MTIGKFKRSVQKSYRECGIEVELSRYSHRAKTEMEELELRLKKNVDDFKLRYEAEMHSREWRNNQVIDESI